MMPKENGVSRAARSRAFSIILGIGLIAGTLDISDSLIFNQLRGITPAMVFQYIASGLIGMRSFRAGLASVALGVILHYAIALSWTGVFYAASRKLALLRRRPVVCGVLYGGAVYLFMNLVVLPLSGVPRLRNAMTTASRINGVLAVVFLIGLTISLLVRKYANPARLKPKKSNERLNWTSPSWGGMFSAGISDLSNSHLCTNKGAL